MADHIRIDISPEALEPFREYRNRLQNLRPLLRLVAGMMADAVEENFERQGRPRWPELAKSTVRQRKREGKWPGKILQRSGRLAASIQSGTGDTDAYVATNLSYAAIHQFGGEIRHPARPRILHFKKHRRGKHKGKSLFSRPDKATFGQKVPGRAYTIRIPARPFLRLTDEDVNEIREKVTEYVKGE